MTTDTTTADLLAMHDATALAMHTEINLIDYHLTGCGRRCHRLPHKAVEFRAVIAQALSCVSAAKALLPIVSAGGFDPVAVERITGALNRLAARLHNVIAHGLTVREGKVEVARMIDDVNLAIGWSRVIESTAKRRRKAAA